MQLSLAWLQLLCVVMTGTPVALEQASKFSAWDQNDHTYAVCTEIISPPQSVSIMPDTVALFNCTAIATFINWKINDTPVDQFTREQFWWFQWWLT